jgi:hypothetical protein
VLTRRTFLGSSVAIFGLPELLSGQDQDDKRPEWLAAALKRMKETRRQGLVFVAPADDVKRRELGGQLAQFARAMNPAARVLAGECVLMCARREIATPVWGAIEEKDNALVLDADGRRLASGALRPERLVSDAVRLLHGEDGARLRAASAAALAALDVADREAVIKAFDFLDFETEPSAPLMGGLRTLADRIAPSLALTGVAAAHPTAREACQRLLIELGDGLAARDGLRLPAGAREVEEELGPKPDPCPACGMAITRPASRKFLEFLTK